MPTGALGAAADFCRAASTSPPPPRAAVFAEAARGEHAAFGGQFLDAEGRLTVIGVSEAEDPRRGPMGTAPWQRVMKYWKAVDPRGRLPSLVRFGALRPADRGLLLQSLQEASASRLQGLGVGPEQGLSSQDYLAIEAALHRVGVIDTPWSAAFVSWLAKEAGLGDSEFTVSEAHADYAGAAWQASVQEAGGQATPYALRACDLARNTPRVGDLVCHARAAAAGLDDFEKLGAVLAERRAGGQALAMHCDVVVQTDAGGIEAIGGNVAQAVTRRRLQFAPGTRLLDPSYRSSGCLDAAGCVDRGVSRQPWSLLLQWR
ncbi:conserved hypothetical protein [Burkholderiales bacterium 8X]|nr:conserved hypothetical protein [Burkholderiales bacterium 8X]